MATSLLRSVEQSMADRDVGLVVVEMHLEIPDFVRRQNVFEQRDTARSDEASVPRNTLRDGD